MRRERSARTNYERAQQQGQSKKEHDSDSFHERMPSGGLYYHGRLSGKPVDPGGTAIPNRSALPRCTIGVPALTKAQTKELPST